MIVRREHTIPIIMKTEKKKKFYRADKANSQNVT